LPSVFAISSACIHGLEFLYAPPPSIQGHAMRLWRLLCLSIRIDISFEFL
jgi:hypothetical protein